MNNFTAKPTMAEWQRLRVDEARFRRNFDDLAAIGATAEGGVHRPALTPPHLEARNWFHHQAESLGLGFRVDGAGNHSAVLECGPKGAATLLLGSHLDSVPHGGRFDGALGVLAALECLCVVQQAGLRLPVNLEAIDFTDEEGTLVGLLGSSALAGSLRPEDLRNPRGGRGPFEESLLRAGLADAGFLTAQRPAAGLTGYLELHIEQGKRLIDAGVQIGVVEAIIGIGSYALTFLGRADHAGTTPMLARRDALQGASAFVTSSRQIVLEQFPGCVANVGQVVVEPGAYNIVPERVELGLEFRSPDEARFVTLEEALRKRAHEDAARFNLDLQFQLLMRHQPAPMHDRARRAIVEASRELGLSHISLISTAGHDAQSVAPLCPAGMLFVPSEGGASHSGREFTAWQDCMNGANVLLQAALRLAQGTS
ncbi:MAG: Zn-dependent hydrolase [Anaerolineales bacterium]